MIIVDLQQVMISNLMQSLGNHTNVEVEENLLRHMVLNSLRKLNFRFRNDYGSMVIACDDRRYWRKFVFPHYKANRKKDREESEMDWSSVFETLNLIRDEIKEYMPYPVVISPLAEADDIIATLVQDYGDTSEKILIVSGDKDFRQLQKYDNVSQYSPTEKKFITEPNPQSYLKEHIMRGDKGDGIPNFLSSDDCFVGGPRQRSLMNAKLEKWIDMEPKEFCDETMLKGYIRNETLVDLTKIPVEVANVIRNKFNEQSNKDHHKMIPYFMEKGLKSLIKDIDQF